MQSTQQLGRYEILAEVGRGAMGAVFRARDPRIDRIVAIKTIAVPETDAGKMEQYRQRFFREAQAAGRLSHPGIVTIFDVEEDGPTDTPFIVMEYAAGRTLNDFVAQSPGKKLPPAVVLDLVAQIASALDYAHSAGIVHRDIKPGNIIVTPEGHTKIMDFGIARTALSELTVPGHVLGTPAYMSPEQINGKPLDGRSDIFSLGVIAYWLLVGVKPFDAESVTELCVQIAAKEPRPATEACTGLNADYDYVLARALAKEPERRYQKAREFAADLQDLRSGKKPRSMSGSSTSSEPERDRTRLLSAEPGKAASAQSTAIPNSPASGTSGHTPWRRKRLALAIAAVAVMFIAGALLGRSFHSIRPRPATLQLLGRYPFHHAEINIWVDGELRYHDNLHDSYRHGEGGGSLGLTLPVQSGRHTVRVQVNAPGRVYDHDTAIPGYFRPFTQKTLRVIFSSRNLDLRWE
ncbi:MAG: serine/threonine-protein kinase [Actinomycetota bacterium]